MATKKRIIQTPCSCHCHTTPGVMHFVACCNDGYIETVTDEDVEEPGEDASMSDKLKFHLETTPRFALQKEWKEIEDMDLGGPTVEDYLQSLPPVQMEVTGCNDCPMSIMKGFTSGWACMFKSMKQEFGDEWQIKSDSNYLPVTPDWCPLKSYSVLLSFKHSNEQ